MGQVQEILAQVKGEPLKGLKFADQRWTQWRQGQIPRPNVVRTSSENCQE